MNFSPEPSLEQRAWRVLAQVHDPEIPAVSIVDLGIVDTVRDVDGRLEVHLLPTFIGCPATEIIKANVIAALADDDLEAQVSLVYEPPWSSERISTRGREQLRAAGFAPPSSSPVFDELTQLSTIFVANCPYCGSVNTTMENLFGPTLCRSIYHCANCRQPFESFKPL